MIHLPRSLTIKPPYRGRTIRSLIRSKVPSGRWALYTCFNLKANWVRKLGQRMLAKGHPEGRRFLANIPHPFCGIGHSHAEWHTAFQWAPLLGLEFVHIPLKGKWDTFFGLKGLPDYDRVLREHKPIIVRVPYAAWSRGADAFPRIKAFVESIRSHRNLLFVLADGQNAYDHITHAGRFKQLFEDKGDWQSLPRHRVEGKLNVGVHLRVIGRSAMFLKNGL